MNLQKPNKLSEQLLLAVKMEEDISALQFQLENLDLNDLKKGLTNDDKKKAFWINIYNAYFQILRKKDKIDKPNIYRKKLFRIAGELLSLDDVEHGILRKYQYKYSLGLITNFFNLRLIKKLEVDKIDYRIHFALNCGAKSCPPIAFYNVEKINSQLDIATQSFLEGESDFDDNKKEVQTTALFEWYESDFGGEAGIKRIFKDQLNKDISDYNIKYKVYSWEEDLDNYTAI